MEQPNAAEPTVELTEENVAIHLELLKRCGYYDIIVQNSGGKNSWTLFGYNGHRLCFGAAIVVIYTALVYGNCGFFAPVVDYELSNVEFCVVINVDLFLLVNLCNTLTLFCHLPEVTSLMEMTRVDFLTSAACRRNRGSVLSDCRAKVIWFSNVYSAFCALAIVQWIVFAGVTDFFSNVVDTSRAAGDRVPTVLYMPFPVSVKTHNDYYLVFFTIEMLITMFSIYTRLMVDLYILSFSRIISAHYEVLGRAFENLGRSGRRVVGSPTGESKANYGDDDRDINVNEELISILSDQLKLVSKLKSFNTVTRPINLTIVGITSVSIVLLTLVFIMIFSSPDSFSIAYLFKVANVDLFFGLELYVYCNFLDSFNAQREATNFAIYSSDWTDMDLKVKKLLLLTMRLNDATPFVIKATPIKIVNLELFVSVLKTCYSIISVMVNSLSKKR